VFELSYGAWKRRPAAQVAEVKRYSIDAGSNMSRVESQLHRQRQGSR
jgi:unsaturated rhamnogalacturonyl hydrolase